MDLYNGYTNQHSCFVPDSQNRMPNSKESANAPDSVIENRFKQNDLYDPHSRQERVNQPLLFSIDYILNLAAKEHQQQSYPHNYLTQLAQFQHYQHQCQQLQLQQHQQQQQQLQQPRSQPQKDNRKTEFDQAQDCRKKKTRTVFTKPQVMHLESVFRVKRYLTCFERSQLANSMNLSETQIKIWFQNRRNKNKREQQSPHVNTILWDHSDPNKYQ